MSCAPRESEFLKKVDVKYSPRYLAWNS